MPEILFEYGLVVLGLLLAPAGFIVVLVGGRRRNWTVLSVGTACFALGVVLLLRIDFAEFWRIDRCLDQGGRWNQESSTCEK
jgi:hypothetical protein